MKAFKLDCYSNWKSLPWNNIKERIFVLQRQIYQSSKACNYNAVHNIQNILVNSSEARVLAIEEIFKWLSKSSLNFNQDIYQLYSKDKFLIFYSIFQKQRTDKILMILMEKVKQYLAYMCLQPEWEARFEPGLQSNISGQRLYLFQEKVINLLYCHLNDRKKYFNTCINYKMINKYINPKYITQKIQSGFYINYCLGFWLNNNYIQESISNLVLFLKFDILHQFFCKIIYNGIEWFNSITIEFHLGNQIDNHYKNRNLCYEANINEWIYVDNTFIDNLDFISKYLNLSMHTYSLCVTKYVYTYQKRTFNISSYKLRYFKFILKLIKYLLYRKDFANRLRANSSISLTKATVTINKLIMHIYSYYGLFLDMKLIKYIYREADFIIYSWVKKRNKNKNLPKLIIHRYKEFLVKSLFKAKQSILNEICLEKISRE